MGGCKVVLTTNLNNGVLVAVYTMKVIEKLTRDTIAGMVPMEDKDTPRVSYDCYEDQIIATASTYHYLNDALTVDEHCEKFNALPDADWKIEGDYYGVTEDGDIFLRFNRFKPSGDSFNTYNGEEWLTHTLQGQYFTREGGNVMYLLLQVHQSGDVRGNYSDAKLFIVRGALPDYNTFYLGDISGEVNGQKVDTSYYGQHRLSLAGEADEPKVKGDGTDKVDLDFSPVIE